MTSKTERTAAAVKALRDLADACPDLTGGWYYRGLAARLEAGLFSDAEADELFRTSRAFVREQGGPRGVIEFEAGWNAGAPRG